MIWDPHLYECLLTRLPGFVDDNSAGYVISAIFICAEYQRLGIYFREYRILRISFWMKLAFIFIEVGLAIGKCNLPAGPPSSR